MKGSSSWLRMRALLPVALALAGVVLLLDLISFGFGESPTGMLAAALAGSWGTPYGIGQVLFKATPLMLTGLAFEVAVRAGLFNVGIEGQLAAASLVGGWVASRLAGGPFLVVLPLVLLSAMATGALVASIPAVLRARREVHEIISTIMLNRIVEVLLPFLLVTVLGEASLRTRDVGPSSAITRLERFVPQLNGSAASFAFFLAIALCFLVLRLLKTTRFGREITWIGKNAEACRAEGIDVSGRLLQAMLLSGAIAGLVMTATVLGDKGYYELGLGSGAGFAGIAVALLARGSPVGLVLAALLLGTLEQAGLAINARVPKEAMSVLEACVILLVAVGNRMADRPAPAEPPIVRAPESPS